MLLFIFLYVMIVWKMSYFAYSMSLVYTHSFERDHLFDF